MYVISEFVFVETEEDETTSTDESSNGNTSSASSGKNNPSTSSQLEQIIQRLPTCVNRDFIDDVSMACAIKVLNSCAM